MLLAVLFHLLFICKSCLDAPFFYISFHDELVLKYSRDGCAYNSPLDTSAIDVQQPRDMLLYNNRFYLTNAQSSGSCIWEFGLCSANGIRPYNGIFVDVNDYDGLDHPYGIAAYNSQVYVSSQHTDNVLRWYQNGTAVPFPTAIKNTEPPKGMSWYNATFVQFGDPDEHDDTEQGVRGLEFDNKGRLWVCNEDLSGVTLYDGDGYEAGTVTVDNSIGIFYDGQSTMYVGSNSDTSPAVVAIDINKLQITATFATKTLTHPCGIIAYTGILYVLDQDSYSIISFNISGGDLIDSIQPGFPDDPEGLFLSDC